MNQLFVETKKAYDSLGREVVSNILTEFVILMELVTLINMYLNETYCKV